MIEEKSRECRVRVKSAQRDTDGETQIFETENKGRLSGKEGVLYVLYEENMEEMQERTGRKKETEPEARVKNLLKIEEGPLRVSLKKSGAVSWEMTFEQGKRRETEYRTPYGILKIGTETERIIFTKGQEKASLQLLYTLFIQGVKQADCRLELSII